jgi:DNA repair exonuclease SbcCD ATPase subunit
MMGFAGPSETVSLECLDDDGRFCVVRATSAGADLRDVEDVLLSVAWQDRDYRFTPVELDAESEDDHSVDFLLPSRLLDDGNFTLHCGSHRMPAGAPTHRPPASIAGLTTEQALLVQQDQLVDQARRLGGLRAEVRGLRERAALAEDALEDARDRFETGLIGQRDEVQDARRRTAEVEAALAEVEERAGTVEIALEAGRGLLAREQEARAEAERQAASTLAELDQARAEAAAAAAELEEARRELESEREEHADAELRLTWAEARLEDKTARVAELDELARRRAQELADATAANADRAAEFEAELTIARAGAEHEHGIRAEAEEQLADARARVAELEAAQGRVAELERQVHQGRSDVAAAAAEVEAERALRIAAEARIEDERWRADEAESTVPAELEEARAALEAERALRLDDRARIDEKAARIDALEHEVRERDAMLEAATAPPPENGDAPAPAPAGAAEELAAVRAELDKVRAANAHIATRLKAAEDALGDGERPDRRAPVVNSTMGARLIALDLAMRGTPREETARYLSDNFDLSDPKVLLDEVYARA